MKNLIAGIVVVALLAVFGAWQLFKVEKPHKRGHHAQLAGGDPEGTLPGRDPSWQDDPATPPAAQPTAEPGQPAQASARRTVAGTRAREAAPAAPEADGNARLGTSVTPVEVPRPPSKYQIIEPPEDAKEPADKTARLAAETYKTLVKTMKLDPEQEERFKQVLYEAKQSYAQVMQASSAKVNDDKADEEARTAAVTEAADVRKKAWDEQKKVGDEAMKNVLGDEQFKIYSSLIQNPLFMANGLQFKPVEDVPKQ